MRRICESFFFGGCPVRLGHPRFLQRTIVLWKRSLLHTDTDLLVIFRCRPCCNDENNHKIFGCFLKTHYLCSDEKGIWEMAIGYSQIYGDCTFALYNICRYARANDHVSGCHIFFGIADCWIGSDIQ